MYEREQPAVGTACGQHAKAAMEPFHIDSIGYRVATTQNNPRPQAYSSVLYPDRLLLGSLTLGFQVPRLRY